MEAEGAGDSRRATIGIGGALAASPVAAEPDLASLSPNREARQATAASDDREVSDESSTLDSDATRRPASTGVPTAGSGVQPDSDPRAGELKEGLNGPTKPTVIDLETNGHMQANSGTVDTVVDVMVDGYITEADVKCSEIELASYFNVLNKHHVDWGPGGSIIFDEGMSVMRTDVNGTRLHVIAGEAQAQVSRLGGFADISPDGRTVVVVSCEFPPESPPGYVEPPPGYIGYLAENESIAPGYFVDNESFAVSAPQAEFRAEYWAEAASVVRRVEFEIATVGLNGDGKTRLTHNRRVDHYPTWSPDGARIAFLSGAPFTGYGPLREYLSSLNSVRADGSDAKVLASGLRIAAFAPQWSPSGDQIAFLARNDAPRPERWDLCIVGSNGSNLRCVAPTVGGYSWSPDGKRLAFAGLDGETVVVATVSANGGSDPEIVYRLGEPWPGRWFDYPVYPLLWSPDGAHIVVACAAGEHLCVVNRGGELIGQSPTGLRHSEPKARIQAAWSPDGARIALRAALRHSPHGEIVVATMAPDGSDVRVLARGGLAVVAEHSDYQDTEAGIAACRAGYVVRNPDSNPGLVSDCESLIELRDILAGETLLNWSAGTPVAQWAGVVVGGSPLRVTGLNLQLRDQREVAFPPGFHSTNDDVRLSGELPPQLSKLTKLRTLILHSHHLRGGRSAGTWDAGESASPSP